MRTLAVLVFLIIAYAVVDWNDTQTSITVKKSIRPTPQKLDIHMDKRNRKLWIAYFKSQV